jgi:cell division protein FtsI (penicillin-binding protein 3)
MREKQGSAWRVKVLWVVLGVALAGLLIRLVDLNILDRTFLLRQSKARILRKISIPAYRGMITDRFGDPLAISTPVDSVWINPQLFQASNKQLQELSHLTHLSTHFIDHRARKVKGREFIYLDRLIPPPLGEQIKALDIHGVFLQREYKRFYPEGEVTAHVVGLTNIDDEGQEGLELAFNKWLTGVPGEKEVLKDRLGHVIDDVALLKKPQQGKELVLSIDHRIQYLAYRALKAAVLKYHAQAGSVVVLNVKTGEILAMVNQPSYNPNRRPKDHDGRYRNRAVTDIFEPGSTMKPFTIALALASGKYQPSDTINTNPGTMWVGGYKIRDDLNYGVVNLTQVLQKSSNIGAAKIMLSLQPQDFWDLLRQLGFGQRTRSGFPGESAGTLVPHLTWYPSVVATLAYGYGIAVTTLQLAHAYAILANHGIKMPVSLVKVNQPPPGVRVLSAKVADTVLTMLESVVEKGGTGTRAAIPGYHVAGKTGTAYIAGPHGYYRHRFMASFVGVAPATNPQLVVAVVIRDPKGHHFGGIVSAPVFAKVMGGALRILDIPPDDLGQQ